MFAVMPSNVSEYGTFKSELLHSTHVYMSFDLGTQGWILDCQMGSLTFKLT